MTQAAVTSLSSKGQIVIPNKIRKELGIETGTKLVILTDGDNLLLKPIQEPKIEVFKKLIKESQKIRIEKKLKKSDIAKAIKKYRSESRS